MFEAFPKIGRLKRDCVVTEKIDGSNAQVYLKPMADVIPDIRDVTAVVGDIGIFAGSRNRWLQPGKNTDNFGFAGWVRENAEELVKLGEGRHFGEWWGLGIQRGYDMTERRFSLFNVNRWQAAETPACCHVVPVLYRGTFNTTAIDIALMNLETTGSVARPGFMKPEGIITFHGPTKTMFKTLLENDEVSKTEALAA